jgi:DNA-directed RNA polymerase subunit F
MNELSEKITSVSEAKELLVKRQKDSDLGYEQQNTLTHLEKFAKLSEDKAEKLRLELNELNILSEKQIAQLLDILPTKENLLKTVLIHDKHDLSGDQLKEILKIVKKYAE